MLLIIIKIETNNKAIEPPPVQTNIIIVCLSMWFKRFLYFCSLAFCCKLDTDLEKATSCSCFFSCRVIFFIGCQALWILPSWMLNDLYAWKYYRASFLGHS